MLPFLKEQDKGQKLKKHTQIKSYLSFSYDILLEYKEAVGLIKPKRSIQWPNINKNYRK